MLSRYFFTLAIALLLADVGRADNWPRFRGPNGDGQATGKDIPNEFSEKNGIAWKLKIPGKGNSSPIIWENKLFLQTSSDDGRERFLLCIDVTKPAILWQRSIPGSKAHIHAKNSWASSTPATDGELVVASIWDGENVSLWAYNFKGEPAWSLPMGPFVSQHGPAASPILYKDFVFFNNDMDKKATLYCINKKTGKIVWSKERDPFRACYSAPFILESQKSEPELIVTNSNAITGYEPATGKVLWDWKWDWSGAKKKGFPLRTISATLHWNGILFSGSGDGGGDRMLTAVSIHGESDSAKPKKIWDSIKDFPYVPCLLEKDNQLFFVNDAGFVGCYDPKEGKRNWYERADSGKTAFSASPILVDDRIFAVSEEGDVYVFAADAKGFRRLGKSGLGEMVRATPAVADGRMYIRGAHHLFCIGKK